MSLFETYLNDLTANLSASSLRKDEIRLEVHSHLRERADALVAEGNNPRAAEERALTEFGSPDEVASRLNSTQFAFALPRFTGHADLLGAIMIYTGVVALFRFISQMGMGTVIPGFAWPRNWILYVIASTLVVPVLQVILGIGLLRHRRQARPLTLLFTAVQPLVALFTLSVLTGGRRPEGYLNAINTIQMAVQALPPLLLFGYALWALTGLRVRRIAWR